MLFNSIDYLIFFPIVLMIYFIIPQKLKNVWLLISSYFFYMSWNPKYILLLFFATLITYLCGILLDRINAKDIAYATKYKKATVGICSALILAILFYFKYTNFALSAISRVFSLIHVTISVPVFDIVLPIGISFFTFQSIGYIIDVYRKEIPAEKNFIQYALFISFFPHLSSGPIGRSKNLLRQFNSTHKFQADNARIGLLTFAYGLFLKIVVADNISTVVNPLFDNPGDYAGTELFLAAALFAFQIYCDFEGYTRMAIGSARILGYHLQENFDAPYMAVSVKDFWRRWHISLTSWFRDYLYIPLGGSRKGKWRKQLNTMIIYLCSGLWHGAAWHYVFWGGLNGFFSIVEDLLAPFKSKMYHTLKINENTFCYRTFQRITTFLLIDLTWIFFRVSLGSGFLITKKIITEFRLEWFINFEFINMFGSVRIMLIILLSILLILLADVLKYLGKDIITLVLKQQTLFRWIIYWLLFVIILYWGMYGEGYEQTQFIYFQF